MKRDEVDMNLSGFCEDEKESRLHDYAILKLSKDLKAQEDDIEPLYRAVFSRYKSIARVKDYLYILTIRKVRHIYESRKQFQKK